MKLVIASSNKNKLREIKAIMDSRFESVCSLSDLGIDVDIEETGTTFEENALIKAREGVRLCGCAVLADDSGLEVAALNGAPGVYSARYAGTEHNDAKNNALLLKNLEGVSDRSARFVTVMALVYPSGETLTAEGEAKGVILHSACGDNGFGYDPLFFSQELNKTFAEADLAEKNSVSHRSRALKNLLAKLGD